MADEPLKIEVGQLILVLESKELLQLGVREDVASVRRILEILGADVSINLASHLRASHHGALGTAEELGQLVAHQGRLDEPARRTSRILVLSLARRLLGGLEVALGLLLNALQLGDKHTHLLAHRIQLGQHGSVGGLVLHGLVLRRLHLYSDRGSNNSNWLSLRGSTLLRHYTLIRGICLSQF